MSNRIVLCAIFFYFFSDQINAQCVSTGPNSPSVIVNDASGGVLAWSNTGDVVTSNDDRTFASALVFGGLTNFLNTAGYGFSIPTSAFVCGIKVEVEKVATGLLFDEVEDETISLLKGGTAVGDNLANIVNWPSEDNYVTYGGNTDLWGTTWTPAEINSANFGVAIQANLTFSLSVLVTARIDHTRITVYYDNSLPIELLDFNAQRVSDDLVEVLWSTVTETDNDFFTVERSIDGHNWAIRGVVDGAGKSTNVLRYAHFDSNPSDQTTFYRLKQTDFNGDFGYSEIVPLEAYQKITDVKIYPNPSEGNLNIESTEDILTIEIIDLTGRQFYFMEYDAKAIEIDLSDLPQDFYFIKMHTRDRVFIQKIFIK